MASIQRRDNGRWRARYRDEAGREHARHFPRKVDAQRWLDEVTSSVVTGTYIDPRAGRTTFAAWWRAWSARQVWADGTRVAADLAASSVTFGDVPLRLLRPSHIEQWIKAMSQPAASRATGLEPSTIRTRFNYVHMALRAAVADRLMPMDPAERVTLPRPRRAAAAMTLPSAEQVGHALEVAKPWFRPFVAVCAFAGLRLGEAAGLQLDDVDFLRRTIAVRRQVQGQTLAQTTVVPPKYGSERVVYVPADLIDLLALHVRDVGVRGDEKWLLAGPGGDLLNRNSAAHQWRTIRAAVGLEGHTLHDLRHFYASGLIAAGCDVVTVQRALGHSSASITLNIYAHLWPTAEDKTRAAATDLMRSAIAAPADSRRTHAQP